MKLLPPVKTSPRNIGFTAIEMLISTTIIALTVIALVSAEIYGLRVYTLAATQLSATASARSALDKIRGIIQSANGELEVGTYMWAYGSPTNFVMLTNGQAQTGNALIIEPSGNTYDPLKPYTLVFLQPGNGGTNFATQGTADQNQNLINTNFLIMETFDTNYNPILTNTLASFITNQQVFTAVAWDGTNVETSEQNNRVIQITLMFSQWEYPIAIIGSNDINAYDYYRLQTRVTRRAIND